MPRASIVIPAYNAAPYLMQTLDAALASTYRDMEIVVIDDGSTDTTAEIAEGYGPPVRPISQKNAGMSATRNRGIDSSDSEYVALLDSDDVWHPEKLRLQMEALQAHPDYAFSYTAFHFWDGTPLPDFVTEPRTGRIDTERSGWIYHHLILENWALPSSVVFRRSAWKELGPFLCDNQQTDDWEFLVRASRSFRFLRLQEPLVLYRQVPTSLSRRVPAQNWGELMRQSLIERFGLTSPDGQKVDIGELERQRYKGWANFADLHCARGDLGIGLRTFGRLLAKGPSRADSLIRLGKSTLRRMVPK